MQEFRVGKNEEGMRIDRLAERLLPKAGSGFVYKMFRKKNIVLNDKRVSGPERVNTGDVVKFYLSDETIVKFGNILAWRSPGPDVRGGLDFKADEQNGFVFKDVIVYEDEDVILVNKPAGLLTQKSVPEDYSLNDALIEYLIRENKLTMCELATFKPSVCNRLDRNTSGLVCCGKSMKGLRELSEVFRDRSVHKYYLAIVRGEMTQAGHLKGFLKKNEELNKVTVLDKDADAASLEGAEPIETAWKPLKSFDGYTLVEVELFTGKSHQIRAHLASIGYPVAGDNKYGDVIFNRQCRDLYKVHGQLLIAYRIVFPEMKELKAISGRSFVAAIPDSFKRMLKEE